MQLHHVVVEKVSQYRRSEMEIIWSLLLTACMDSQSCVQQDIQWFEEKYQCIAMKALHEELPVDGDWKTIDYKCTIVGAKEV